MHEVSVKWGRRNGCQKFEIRWQIRVSPKGISMICSVPFPVVLLAKPSSFFNASRLYAFYSCIVSIIAAALIIAVPCEPVLGLQPTIPRSGKCANYAAARAPQSPTSRKESWAMRKRRLTFGVEGASWQCHAGGWKKSRTQASFDIYRTSDFNFQYFL